MEWFERQSALDCSPKLLFLTILTNNFSLGPGGGRVGYNFLLCSLQVNIGQGSHPQKVKVFGPGVERSGLKANEPTHFTVDCTEAGEGKMGLPQRGDCCSLRRNILFLTFEGQ